MSRLGRPRVDVRKKLRATMDELALSLAESLKRVSDPDEKYKYFDTLTKYMAMANREPEEAEGGDIVQFRDRLARLGNGHGGAGGAGDDSDPDPPDGDDPDNDGAGDDGARPAGAKPEAADL